MRFSKLCRGVYVSQDRSVRITDTPRSLPRKEGENWGVFWKTGMVGVSTRLNQSQYFPTLKEAKGFANNLTQ